jgi:hypothetical protein
MDSYHDEQTGRWSRVMKIAFTGFALIAGLLLVLEHSAHVLPLLPFALLAACPLMHIFMHGGHGGHSGHADHGQSGSPGEGRSPAPGNPVSEPHAGHHDHAGRRP